MRLPVLVAAGVLLAGCSGEEEPARVSPLSPEEPRVACSDLEPNPVAAPLSEHVAGACSVPGGKRWVNAFYQCTDGRIWLVISDLHPPASPPEPTGAEFDACVGRQGPPQK